MNESWRILAELLEVGNVPLLLPLVVEYPTENVALLSHLFGVELVNQSDSLVFLLSYFVNLPYLLLTPHLFSPPVFDLNAYCAPHFEHGNWMTFGTWSGKKMNFCGRYAPHISQC